MGMRGVAVIDGEHYAPVVRAALAELPYEVVGAWLAGGGEKLRGGDDYAVPLGATLEEALAGGSLTWSSTSRTSRCSARASGWRWRAGCSPPGSPTRGRISASTRRSSPPVGVPSLAIAGTGKRVGKTAVTGHVARLLAQDRRVVVVAMGRGGPPEPEVIESRPTWRRCSSARAPACTGRPTTSRRPRSPACPPSAAAGPEAGSPARSAARTCREGVEAALALDPELLLFDGSGAALPPVAADARVLVVPAHQPPDTRHRLPERVPDPRRRPGRGLARRGPADAHAVARSRPRGQGRAGRSARCSAPARWSRWPGAAWRSSRRRRRGRTRCSPITCCTSTGAEHVAVSGNLATAPRCTHDVEGLDADVFLVELKAAAVDVVAEAAFARGIPLILADADLRALPGEPDSTPRCARSSRPGEGGARDRAAPARAAAARRRTAARRYSKGLMARALMATGLARAGLRAGAAPRARGGCRGTARASRSIASRRSRTSYSARRARAVQRLRRYARLQRARRCPSCCSSAARPAPASRRSRPRLRTGSGSRVSPPPTSSVRRCGRSSRGVHAVGPLLELRGARRRAATRPEQRLHGFLDQTRNVLVGVQAALDRALHEGWSMVIEGVHLVPGMVCADRGAARRPVRRRDRGRGGAPRATSRSATRRPTGCGRSTSTSSTSPTSARCRTTSSSARGGTDVPVVENRRPSERRSREVIGLVLDAAERVERVPMTQTAPETGPRRRSVQRPACICETYARATERAALAGARWLGRADQQAAAASRDAGDARCARRSSRSTAARDRCRGGRTSSRRASSRRGRGVGRPRRRPDRGQRRRRARRERRHVDARGRVAGLAADAAGHVHAQDGGRPARARPIDLLSPVGDNIAASPRRSAAARTTSRRSSSTGRATTT